MKQILNTVIIAAIALIAFSITSCNTITGNGEIITQELNTSPFDEVTNHSSLNVTIIYSDTYKVIIEAESNLMPYILTVVNEHSLVIKTKPNITFKTFKDVRITVYCKNLEDIYNTGSGYIYAEEVVANDDFKISNTGSGDVEIKNITGCDDLEIRITGSGEVDVNYAICESCEINVTGSGNCKINELIVGELDVEITGSGDLTLSGECYDAEVKLTGSGKYHAYELYTNKYDIRITGSGSAQVRAIDMLTVRISGSGDVYYYGNPQINVSGSGSGKVISKN